MPWCAHHLINQPCDIFRHLLLSLSLSLSPPIQNIDSSRTTICTFLSFFSLKVETLLVTTWTQSQMHSFHENTGQKWDRDGKNVTNIVWLSSYPRLNKWLRVRGLCGEYLCNFAAVTEQKAVYFYGLNYSKQHPRIWWSTWLLTYHGVNIPLNCVIILFVLKNPLLEQSFNFRYVRFFWNICCNFSTTLRHVFASGRHII